MDQDRLDRQTSSSVKNQTVGPSRDQATQASPVNKDKTLECPSNFLYHWSTDKPRGRDTCGPTYREITCTCGGDKPAKFVLPQLNYHRKRNTSHHERQISSMNASTSSFKSFWRFNLNLQASTNA